MFEGWVGGVNFREPGVEALGHVYIYMKRDTHACTHARTNARTYIHTPPDELVTPSGVKENAFCSIASNVTSSYHSFKYMT
jgi:hypothetical protein